MNRVAQAARPVPGEHPAGSGSKIHRVLVGVVLAAAGVATAGVLSPGLFPRDPNAPLALLLVLAAISTLVSLARHVPAQNALLAAVIIALFGSAAHVAGALTGIPFGPFVYGSSAEPLLLHVSWTVPFLWIVIVLNSRGVARLIMRPWRKTRVYGLWIIGLTATLTLLFELGFEPFATRVKDFWLWSPSKLPFDWYGAPVSNFLGWVVVTLITLGFATPALMKRKPGKSVPDYAPLILWVALNLLFAAGDFTRQLWLAAGFNLAASVVASVFAIRGAQW